MSDIERLMSKVKIIPSGCWEFHGSLDVGGYGRLSYKGTTRKAHRVSFLLFKGEIPEGKIILHSCDNRLCVNPAHLSVGTHLDNKIDCIKKGREYKLPSGKGEDNPHSKLTAEMVKEIRCIKGLSQRKIAKMYNVSRSAINNILSGVNWGDVR